VKTTLICAQPTAVTDSQLTVAHACILLRIVLLKNIFFCMQLVIYVRNLLKIGP